MPGKYRPTMQYSTGYGTGVAEALGNWGFSNEVASPGHELSRMLCLLERMEELRSEPKSCPSRDRKSRCCPPIPCQPSCTGREPPAWLTPGKKPMICYTEVHETLLTSDKHVFKEDKIYPVPRRVYDYQRSDHWYKGIPFCLCPQPSCPVPYCPPYDTMYCYNNCCL